MSAGFQELAHAETELGELILRRRRPVSRPDTWIYEVKLAGRFLMSSLVSASERELAARALAQVRGDRLRVLVGGLGLGHTAAAALDDRRVQHLLVVERLPQVVAWHRERLVPLGSTLCGDPRCEFAVDDCLQLLQREPDSAWDAVLLDIDDSPADLLDGRHAAFYERGALRRARRWLVPGGVLALWTNVPADAGLQQRLQQAFAAVRCDDVRFDNPLLGEPEINGLYFARA